MAQYQQFQGEALSGATNLQDECESLAEPEHGTRPPVFQAISGLFSGIFAEATILKIDPTRCISIKEFRSRPICRWGVRKIKHNILGHSSSETFVKGFVSTGKFSVVSEIPEEHKNVVVGYLKERGETAEKAQQLATHGKWFHIVEGGHVHKALLECIEEFSEKFAGFRWPVVEISWQPGECLRAIGRMCNEMQKDDHIIDFPLPDAMQSLRDIIDSHSKNTGVAIIPGKRIKPGFIKEVVDIYAGRQGYSCNTLRTICGTVLRMSSSFVSSMRSLLTEECDEFWKSLGAKRPFGDDTRVFKKLISTQSLKRTPKFLNHNILADEDRVNVIHRLIFLAKERESFKAFSSAEIESQSQNVVAARREVLKFDEFLGEEACPSDVENIRRNMLQTTLLDSVIREHIAGPGELLPAIVNAYLKTAGAHGSQKLWQYQRMRELEKEQSDEIVGTSACRRSRRAEEIQGNERGEPSEGIELSESNENEKAFIDTSGGEENGVRCNRENRESIGPPETDSESLLSEAGVVLRIETLLEYERGSVGIDGSFDFVVVDPFQKVGTDPSEEQSSTRVAQNSAVLDELVDNKGVTLYLQSIRRMLKRGGHLFVFLDWHQIQQWKRCCIESQFEIICDPFLVMKDPVRVQRMTLKGLQSIYEPAIVVRKPGEHPDGFEINKSSPYTHLPACRMPRWCNVIDGVPPAAQKVTFKPSRAQVRPNEKPCALYIELLMTFCPAMGKVLDPFSATLTTGLACMATGRRCVLLETDEKCISYAKPRAIDFAKSRLLEKDREKVLEASHSESENNCISVPVGTPEDGQHGGEDDESLSRRNEGNREEITSESRTRLLESDSTSNTSVEAVETPRVLQPSERSSAGSEKDTSRELRRSQMSSVCSPSISKKCKKLSFVTSQNNDDREMIISQQTNNLRFGSVVGEVSSPIAKKRARKNRSPAANRNRFVESTPPSMFRRSKRSRKVTVQYGC